MARTTRPVPDCRPRLAADDLGEPEAELLARGFAALGDPVRLKLVNLMLAGDGGEACVCDLVGPAGRSQPTVSHHLKILREAGLVTSEKRGTWSWYRVVPEALDRLRACLGSDL